MYIYDVLFNQGLKRGGTRNVEGPMSVLVLGPKMAKSTSDSSEIMVLVVQFLSLEYAFTSTVSLPYVCKGVDMVSSSICYPQWYSIFKRYYTLLSVKLYCLQRGKLTNCFHVKMSQYLLSF